MTLQEAIAAVAVLPGVTQQMVDALEDGIAGVERERDEARNQLRLREIDLQLCQAQLNVAQGRLAAHAELAAAEPLPF